MFKFDLDLKRMIRGCDYMDRRAYTNGINHCEFKSLLRTMLFGICLSYAWGIAVSAENTQKNPSEQSKTNMDQAMADLLNVLEQETEIATKTKMNVDFVPGMVSVLHGNDLLKRGIRTVYEALSLVPGVETSASHDGQLQVIVRDVGKTFSSGKVKYLLNGVPYNTTLNGAANVLSIPINLVNRIDVIRGPGSAVYGEFASVGVINIITNKAQQDAFGYYGTNSSYTLGGQYANQYADSDISLALGFSYQNKKGGDIDAGPDILATSPRPQFRNLSNSPGPINDKEENKVFLFDVGYKNFNLNWQYTERDFGDYFGAANALPVPEQKIIREVTTQNVELSHKWEIEKTSKSNLKLGWFQLDMDSQQQQLFPDGFPLPDQEGNPTFGPVLGAPNYVEDKYYVNLDFNYIGIQQHDMLFGVNYSNTEQGETYAVRNYYVDDGRPVRIPNGRYTGDYNWIAEGLSRRVFALYAQDQYSISNRWTLTAGLRWDDYSDIGSDVTPRLAAVYQLADYQTIKAQYAESFRPPTFLEMYVQNNAVVSGNPNLKSEHLSNIELGYVFNDGLTIARATIFYYDLKDLIAIDTTSNMYKNQGEINGRGVELEYIQQLARQVNLDSNLSYTHADSDNGQQIPGVAQLMANLGVIYQPIRDVSLNAQYRYVGERARQEGDSRGALRGYGLFDITASQANFLTKGLVIRFSVKNLFDQKVSFPSFLVDGPEPGENIRPGYVDDLPQSGRELVAHIEYQF